jgi:hypothetical protein
MYIMDQYRGTILSCRYAIPAQLASASSRNDVEKLVKVAVADTILVHPMLQVGMQDATSKAPSWMQLQSLDLRLHIKWIYLDAHVDFERVFQERFSVQLDERFHDIEGKQPGWKITVMRQEESIEMLLTWNHHQFDAVSARVIHEDLLAMLNAAAGKPSSRPGLNGDILTLPSTPPVLPTPIEDLRALPLSPMFFAKTVYEEIRPQFLNRDPSWARWCPILTSPYKTQFRSFFVDNASLSALVALCRKNKTTITGLLNGLTLLAFSANLDSAAAPAFQCATIIDHRRNLPPSASDAPWGGSDRAVSNYVTQAFHKFDTHLVSRMRSKLPAATDTTSQNDLSSDLQALLWSVSAQNRLEIVQKLNAGLQNDLLGMFKWVGDWQKTMKEMASKPRQFSWLVTNIGVLDGKAVARTGDGGRWAIERAQFGLSAEVPQAAIEISPVSVAGRGMCVGVDWHDAAVETGFAERVVGDLERWLGQLARGS